MKSFTSQNIKLLNCKKHKSLKKYVFLKVKSTTKTTRNKHRCMRIYKVWSRIPPTPALQYKRCSNNGLAPRPLWSSALRIHSFIPTQWKQDLDKRSPWHYEIISSFGSCVFDICLYLSFLKNTWRSTEQKPPLALWWNKRWLLIQLLIIQSSCWLAVLFAFIKCQYQTTDLYIFLSLCS